MMILGPVLFLFVGISFLIWNERVAKRLQTLHWGKEGGWFIFYKIAVIFAGIVFLLGAYGLAFGPVYL